MHVALFFALPGLLSAMTLLPGALFVSRFRSKKNITSILLLCKRSLILVLAVIPWLPEGVRPFVFVSVIALMHVPESLAQTSLQSFLGTIFTGSVRARAIALRNKFGHMFILIVSLMTGMILSFLPQNDDQRMMLYQVFFVLAFCVGLGEIFVFRKFREPPEVVLADGCAPAAPMPPKAGLADIKKALKHKPFLLFLGTTLLIQFSWQAGWPLTSVHQIQVVRSTEIWFALYTVAMGIGAFFAAGFWNKMIDKRGNHFTLVLSGSFMAFNMLFIGLATIPPAMVGASLFAGFATIGLITSLLNGLLSVTPNENRIIYIGIYNSCVGLSLFLSPLFAALLLGLIGGRNAIWSIFVLRLTAALLLLVVAWAAKKRSNQAKQRCFRL